MYIDDHYCDHCEKDTKQEINESTHERDSSFDVFRCTECKWVKFGLTDEYEEPYKELED